MIWLIAEIWIYLFAAFAAGVGAGWLASPRRGSAAIDVASTPTDHAAAVEAPPAQEPRRLAEPEGNADDLTQIIGIGAAAAQRLHGLGVYHFTQIAGWTDAHARWIESQFGEPGRVGRERWIEQARGLCGEAP